MMMRKHNFSRIVLAGSLVLPFAQFAMGQQPRPAAGQQGQAGARQGNDLPGRSDANRNGGQARTDQILRGSQLIGATVDLRGGSRFGTISDFVVSDSGCVDYVVANYQGQYVPIPWAAAMYQPGQRAFLLDIDPARIHEMPMYHQISELTNQQFSQRVHTFYRGVQGQKGDNQPHPAAGQPGAGGQHTQAAPQTAPNRPAAGQTQGTGNRKTASHKGGDRR